MREEISQKYHLLVIDQKEQGKYLAKVEQQLAEVEEEKLRLESRLQGVMEKLSAATDDKHRVEMTMEDMRLNLTETRSENSKLSENVDRDRLKICHISFSSASCQVEE